MERFIKPLIEVIEIDDYQIICTSGSGSGHMGGGSDDDEEFEFD